MVEEDNIGTVFEEEDDIEGGGVNCFIGITGGDTGDTGDTCGVIFAKMDIPNLEVRLTQRIVFGLRIWSGEHSFLFGDALRVELCDGCCT